LSSIFLSHSHSDKPFVRKLAADLRAAGHSVWIDEAELNIGDSLIDKIREGLDDVDYVAAILSENSLKSEWVHKELEIASNRELKEKRGIVLPLLIEKVNLPGFLEGKFYGDFSNPALYQDTFDLLLRKLGKPMRMPDISTSEISRLETELETAKVTIQKHKSEIEIHHTLALSEKSKSLVSAIKKANKGYPLHAPINSTYAFELGTTPITLDYLLWVINKVRLEGSHPMEFLLSVEGKWDKVIAMLEAYKELLSAINDTAKK
jgi:hypothetical protein